MVNSSGRKTAAGRHLFAVVIVALLVGPGLPWPAPALAAAGSDQPAGWLIQCVDCPKRFMELGERSLAIDADGNPHLAYGGDHLYYARHDGSTWRLETADDILGTGWATGLALDGKGQPHIVYTDSSAGLRYAYRDDRGWHRETLTTERPVGGHAAIAVDGNGFARISYRDGRLRYAYRTAIGWIHETVDHGVDSYGGCSLALDGSGRPHIAYRHGSGPSTGVRYARRDAGGWQVEIVEQVAQEEGWMGEFASLALDARGDPHVSYTRLRYPLHEVRYATRDSRGWRRQTVVPGASLGVHTSLVLDREGNPHLTYPDQGGPSILMYAVGDGLSWQYEAISSGENVAWSLALDRSGQPHVGVFVYAGAAKELRYLRRDPGPFPARPAEPGQNWRPETVDREGNTGWRSSLALDGSGYPHISYLDLAESTLTLAHQDRSGWHFDIVDSDNVRSGSTSLALDAAGNAHISYQGIGLRYARQDGGAWQITTVDEYYGAGNDSSLALDANGYPHIVYETYMPAYGLAYAYQDDGGWHVESLAGQAGAQPSLALDNSGRPHVSFSDNRESDLVYAYRDAAGWHVETVDGAGAYVGELSLALDQADRPHISYSYWPEAGPSGELRYAHQDGAGWHIATVDAGGGESSSLALDGEGKPHIAYFSPFGPTQPARGLRYARPLAAGEWQMEMVDTGDEGGIQGYLAFISLALDDDGRASISYRSQGWGYLKLATRAVLPMRVYLPVG